LINQLIDRSVDSPKTRVRFFFLPITIIHPQLRMSRGKSYEGAEFRLSWTITLEVPDKRRQAKGKGGCKGAPPTKTILSNIGASRVYVRVRAEGGWCAVRTEP